MKSGIYKISFGDKFYIGSSKNLDNRKANHYYRLRSGSHKVIIQEAYELCKRKALFSVLEYVNTELLLAREQYYLDEFYNDPLCLNTMSVALANGSNDCRLKSTTNSKANMLSIEREVKLELYKTLKAEEKLTPNSRRILVVLKDSSNMEFSYIREAAEYFNIKEALVSQWLSMRSKCPALSNKTKYDGTLLEDALFKYVQHNT